MNAAKSNIPWQRRPSRPSLDVAPRASRCALPSRLAVAHCHRRRVTRKPQGRPSCSFSEVAAHGRRTSPRRRVSREAGRRASPSRLRRTHQSAETAVTTCRRSRVARKPQVGPLRAAVNVAAAPQRSAAPRRVREECRCAVPAVAPAQAQGRGITAGHQNAARARGSLLSSCPGCRRAVSTRGESARERRRRRPSQRNQRKGKSVTTPSRPSSRR